jgi:hypothetical protein
MSEIMSPLISSHSFRMRPSASLQHARFLIGAVLSYRAASSVYLALKVGMTVAFDSVACFQSSVSNLRPTSRK